MSKTSFPVYVLCFLLMKSQILVGQKIEYKHSQTHYLSQLILPFVSCSSSSFASCLHSVLMFSLLSNCGLQFYNITNILLISPFPSVSSSANHHLISLQEFHKLKMSYAALLLPFKLLFPDGYWKINTQIPSLVCHTLMFPYPFFSFTSSTAVLPFPVRSTLFSPSSCFSSLFYPIFFILLLQAILSVNVNSYLQLVDILYLLFCSTSEVLRDKFLFFSSTLSVHERRVIYMII